MKYTVINCIADYPVNEMVIVEFPAINYKLSGFYKVIKETKKFSVGVWGYSDCPVQYKADFGRVYFFFENDSDLLVFKLRLPFKITHTTIWPSKLKFLVYPGMINN